MLWTLDSTLSTLDSTLWTRYLLMAEILPLLLSLWPWLLAMALLIGLSAFFSASEAALFYLSHKDRSELASCGVGGRASARLLKNPDRLLACVLFYNLVVNITYFAIVSIVSVHMKSQSWWFVVGSLLVIIFCSEMIPKSIAIHNARRISLLVGVPLEGSLRIVSPILPLLEMANLLSRRLIWPGFRPEAYLEVADIERVINLSTDDAHLAEQQRDVLNNIVALSDLRVDECMRPRPQTELFEPPIHRDDLRDRRPPSGYLLVTSVGGDDLSGAVRLADVTRLPSDHIESVARPVAFIPWCSSAADALEMFRSRNLEVAAVVNEIGETVGVVTLEDLLEVIFGKRTTRSDRLMNRHAIQQAGPGRWIVTGMTTLRRLARELQIELPRTKNITVAGVLLESLQRIPTPGDECRWGTLLFRVSEVPDRGQMIVELMQGDTEEGGSP